MQEWLANVEECVYIAGSNMNWRLVLGSCIQVVNISSAVMLRVCNQCLSNQMDIANI